MALEKVDPLSQSYFDKFLVRVEILSEFHKRKAYSDVIREGQEALELFLKALLRSMGAEPSFTHDPGKELAPLIHRIPADFKDLALDLVKWSKSLRKDRELSFYGAADFIPTQNYSKEDAEGVIEFLNKVSRALKKWRRQ